MTRTGGSPVIRHLGVCALLLGCIFHTAPWPGPQAAFHAALVLALAPEFRSPFVGLIWSAAAGWLLEGTLRVYPQYGGTALANMVMTLIAHGMLIQWPPQGARALWGRMAGLVLGHALLLHLCILLAAGRHTWGWDWIWSLASVPLWASLAFKLHRPLHRK